MKKSVQVSFLQGRDEGAKCVTFGVPWAKGEITQAEEYTLTDSMGNAFPLQSAISATWPDGSVKWSRHSANLNKAAMGALTVSIEKNPCADKPLAITCGETISVDTGVIQAVFSRAGSALVQSIRKDGKTVCTGGFLTAMVERRDGFNRTVVPLEGSLQSTEIEENGAVCCGIKMTGIHVSETGERLFPFVVRFKLYKGSEDMTIVHTFLYDGDANRDFLKGLGMRFSMPVSGEWYNRHVKIAGDCGFFHEPLQMLTSWRPRIDAAIYENQMKGIKIEADQDTLTAAEDITLWGNYKITQDSSEHYVIQKRTRNDICTFIDAAHGARAKGVLYSGSHSSGLAVGLRNFFEKYPSALWIEDMHTDSATLTAWLWTPDAGAADLRHYDTVAHSKAYYEGFDEIRSSPYGIANTNELVLRAFTDGIPEDDTLDHLVKTVQKPAVMTPCAAYMHEVRAFGTWPLLHTETAQGRWFEAQLDQAIDFYKNEIEQRKWFGFFNYGDFMHTYDNLRHVWRYDMGGYAWQNTELVPTMWLWITFLRSGREDVFTLAEAMCRHTAEVDMYHFGEYKGLGSRHNVVHWGCACKEARVAMAGHHRYYYYLTGDMRTGQVMDDVQDAEFGIERLDPLRFFYADKQKTHARTGPDWSALCSNWLAAWERHGNTLCRDKMLKGIEGIKAAPLKLMSGSDFGFDPDTGEMIYIGEQSGGGSHLVICMGAPQVWFEMADSIDDPEWDDMMAEYGRFYLLPPEEKQAYSKNLISGNGFAYPYMAAAMIAYYANRRDDAAMVKRLWGILKADWEALSFKRRDISKPFSAFAQTDVPGISTNFISQWCLNTMMCLELIGDGLEKN